MNGLVPVLKMIVVAVAATITSLPGADAKAADGQRIVVEISKFKFHSDVSSVQPGDIVVWRNLDIVPHTVTAKDDSWDSGLIEAGAEWETVITADMIESYYCQYHPSMIGSHNIEGH